MRIHNNDNRRKAQVVSPDFIMGLVLFTSIIVICVTLWNITYTRTSWLSQSEDMQRRGYYLSNTLINTPGAPAGWNATTVASIGLKEDDTDKLDSYKLLEFTFMPYQDSKELLGLDQYDYFVNFSKKGKPLKTEGVVRGTAALISSKQFNDNVRELLRTYSNEWDYYWGSNTQAPTSDTLRYTYYESTEWKLFDMFINNITAYDTIIIEGLQSTTPSEDEENALQEFVDNGGTLIDINDDNDAAMISHFGITQTGTDASDGSGTVVNRDIIIPRLAVGDGVTFNTKKYKFDITTVDKPIAISNSHHGYCLICMWEYGNGQIYYLPDTKDETGNTIEGLDFDGIELFFGNMTFDTARNIVPVRRLIMIENDGKTEAGTMEFYIYN